MCTGVTMVMYYICTIKWNVHLHNGFYYSSYNIGHLSHNISFFCHEHKKFCYIVSWQQLRANSWNTDTVLMFQVGFSYKFETSWSMHKNIFPANESKICSPCVLTRRAPSKPGAHWLPHRHYTLWNLDLGIHNTHKTNLKSCAWISGKNWTWKP